MINEVLHKYAELTAGEKITKKEVQNILKSTWDVLSEEMVKKIKGTSKDVKKVKIASIGDFTISANYRAPRKLNLPSKKSGSSLSQATWVVSIRPSKSMKEKIKKATTKK